MPSPRPSRWCRRPCRTKATAWRYTLALPRAQHRRCSRTRAPDGADRSPSITPATCCSCARSRRERPSCTGRSQSRPATRLRSGAVHAGSLASWVERVRTELDATLAMLGSRGHAARGRARDRTRRLGPAQSDAQLDRRKHARATTRDHTRCTATFTWAKCSSPGTISSSRISKASRAGRLRSAAAKAARSKTSPPCCARSTTRGPSPRASSRRNGKRTARASRHCSSTGVRQRAREFLSAYREALGDSGVYPPRVERPAAAARDARAPALRDPLRARATAGLGGGAAARSARGDDRRALTQL